MKDDAAANVKAFSVDPDENLTILTIVAPLFDAVKREVSDPIDSAVVKVTEPAVSVPIVTLEVPNVALRPFTETALNVAIFDCTTMLIRV